MADNSSGIVSPLTAMGTELKDILVVMVTAPDQKEADRIAEEVVRTRHAACATTVPSVGSIYWWEGKLVKEQETLLVLKTTGEKFLSLQEMIRKMHPYKVPEIIAMPVTDGLPQYIEWVRGETF